MATEIAILEQIVLLEGGGRKGGDHTQGFISPLGSLPGSPTAISSGICFVDTYSTYVECVCVCLAVV